MRRKCRLGSVELVTQLLRRPYRTVVVGAPEDEQRVVVLVGGGDLGDGFLHVDLGQQLPDDLSKVGGSVHAVGAEDEALAWQEIAPSGVEFALHVPDGAADGCGCDHRAVVGVHFPVHLHGDGRPVVVLCQLAHPFTVAVPVDAGVADVEPDGLVLFWFPDDCAEAGHLIFPC